jgi:1-deoxy-D-xylulose-5-phosphate reductoisomerase
MKRLSVLGCTGSIGRSALRIAAQFPERFSVKSLAAGRNIQLLADQIRQFEPEIAVVIDEKAAADLANRLPSSSTVAVLHGSDGYCRAASHDSVDITLTAMVGAAGLLPTLAAIDAGKTIALANKETLVMAGEIVMRRAQQKGVDIRPVDSEHSAIFQCLQGQRREDVHQIVLTASGGPFRELPLEAFSEITREQALNHPNWSMGPKITIDSATLMNKGLEVLEARWLFDFDHEHIRVVVHPQSIVHSMVAYRDGAIIAQMGIPDMKGAIAYALTYPERLPLQQPLPNFSEDAVLTFQDPDFEKFPCLRMAFEVCRQGGTLPAVLNAANEMAVAAFLADRIGYVDIAAVIAGVLDGHQASTRVDLDAILAADTFGREKAEALIRLKS